MMLQDKARAILRIGVLLVAASSFGCEIAGPMGDNRIVIGKRTPDPIAPMYTYKIHETFGSEASKQGVMYLKMKKWHEAIGQFEIAVEMKAEDHNSAWMAGLAFEQSGDSDAACEWYRRACIHRSSKREYVECRMRACDAFDANQ